MPQPPILPIVTATRFDRRLGSGRTKPCIIFAETEEHEEVELVVKFASGCEFRGLVSEVFASLIADDLDLPVPNPFLVEITEEFARAIPDREIAESITRSCGLNFGSRKASSTILYLANQPSDPTSPPACSRRGACLRWPGSKPGSPLE